MLSNTAVTSRVQYKYIKFQIYCFSNRQAVKKKSEFGLAYGQTSSMLFIFPLCMCHVTFLCLTSSSCFAFTFDEEILFNLFDWSC